MERKCILYVAMNGTAASMSVHRKDSSSTRGVFLDLYHGAGNVKRDALDVDF